MFVKVNGVNLFYEKTGQGRPIILLHGNSESHMIFDVLTEQLSDRFTVYAIDSRGHGQSSSVKNLDYEIMAEDIAAFVKELEINKPILYGFSDGGILGLILAYRYPDLLSKLIISGANLNPKGTVGYVAVIERIVYCMTRSSKWKLMLTQPDIKDEQLAKIIVPTLVLAGSKDMIKESHTKHIAEQISNSTLKIIPGESHMSYVIHSNKLYGIIIPFLENDSDRNADLG